MELLSNQTSNSKLYCYFCLRCNSGKHLNVQGETDICGNDKDEAEAMSSFQEFSLRNLYRFLNLLHSDKEERDFKDIKMLICSECFRLNDEFSNLYNLLEETKLRLNWNLKKMEDVMTKAAKVAEDDENNNILQIWRTHTLDRMQKFTRASFPLVLLQKNERKRRYPWIEEGESASATMGVTVEKTIASASRAEPKVVDKLNLSSLRQPVHSQPSCSADADQHPFEDNGEATYFTDDGDARVIHENGPSIQKECDAVVAKPGSSSSSLKIYDDNIGVYETLTENFIGGQMRNHIEVGREMENATQNVLLTLQKEGKAEVNSNIGNQGRGVPAFTSKFTPVHSSYRTVSSAGRPSSVTSMVAHVARFHQEQCLISEQDKALTAEASTSFRYSPKCPYCRYETNCLVGSSTALSSMEQHLVRFHPEHYLIDEKDKASGLWHSQFKIILKNMIYPSFNVNKEGNQRTCACCGKTFNIIVKRNDVNFNKHLIFHHRHELREKFKAILEDPSSEETLKMWSSSFQLSRVTDKTELSSDCPYCNNKTVAQLPTGSAPAFSSVMILHLVRYHPEHYLIDEKDKSSGLWHEEFPKIFQNMIYPSFMTEDGDQRSCTLCEKIYKYKNASQNDVMLQKHLIFQHKWELKKKFEFILEDPLLDEQLGASNKVGCLSQEKAGHSTNCPYCSYKTVAPIGSRSAKKSMVSHFITIHPEHYLIDEKDKAAGLWHDQFAAILAEIIYPNLISSEGNHRSCTLCQKTYKGCSTSSNIKMMKKHLIFCHKVELKEWFKFVLENVDLSDVSNNCTIKYSWKCSYCRFECTNASNSRNSMERHLVRFHPEHFFKEETSTLKHPQFQRILSEIIFPKYVLMTESHAKCSLCEMEYIAGSMWENITCARRHVILRHQTELKKSINDVLEDPTLEKTLAISSANGVACSCGVYLEGRSGLSSYHKNFHCIKVEGPGPPKQEEIR